MPEIPASSTKEAMIYEYIYPVAVLLFIVSGIILAFSGWLVYHHKYYDFIDWVKEMHEKGFIRVIDMTMGTESEAW